LLFPGRGRGSLLRGRRGFPKTTLGGLCRPKPWQENRFSGKIIQKGLSNNTKRALQTPDPGVNYTEVSKRGDTMKKLAVLSALAVAVCGLFLSGCATMFHTKEATVAASSGKSYPVKVMDYGLTVYEGNLPATFAVQSGHSYTVIYTTEGGESRTISIGDGFNGWVIGSFFLGVFPIIIDLATGNITQVKKHTVLPISYSPNIVLTDYITAEGYSQLEIVGNIYGVQPLQ
jgi:hypothetical protein